MANEVFVIDSTIVDFPSSRTSMPRSVRFSTHIEGRYIPYPTVADNIAKSYCHEDYMHFKNALYRDAVSISRKMYGRDRNEPMDRKTSQQLTKDQQCREFQCLTLRLLVIVLLR